MNLISRYIFGNKFDFNFEMDCSQHNGTYRKGYDEWKLIYKQYI